MKDHSAAEPRPLHRIADDIFKHWRAVLGTPAHPYAHALRQLATTTDTYGVESGRDIVLGFLANADDWESDAATRIKAELEAHLYEQQ